MDIPKDVADALKEKGFIELHRHQAKAIPIALEGHSLVVSVPTASGKSIIGYISAMKMVLKEKKKVLYIVPLKALASEKMEDLDSFSHLGYKVAMSVGDLDSDGGRINDADIIVATSEKADSMIRHGNRWIESVGLVIADEIHMIHDPGRGPTLEVTLTKLMKRNPKLQIIALSATISNAMDLAVWLDAELIVDDWRPIPLKEGVYFNDEITFENMERVEVPREKDPIWGLVKQTVKEGGQCLVFVNTRRSTESLARRFSDEMNKLAGRTLSPQETALLEGGAEPTTLGRQLAECVASGTAFHNAGLTYKQRKYVEDNFRNGNIKCIIATPTLAAGINLPARRVIIRDTGRYEANVGTVPISVMEMKQMSGRAGRPGYDPYGEAVLIAKNQNHFDHLMYDYIQHDTEHLTSNLGNENTLRSHILGLIATGDASTDGEVIDFLESTFYGSTSSMYGAEEVVKKVTDFLSEEEMIEKTGDFLRILPFGKRISDLYIDPKSAVILRDAVRKIKDDTEDIEILIAAALTPDVMGLYPKKSDEDRLNAIADRYQDSLLYDPFDDKDLYDEFVQEIFMGAVKVSAMITDWISEVPEESITNNMGIGPGDIRSRIEMINWIMYAMSEIAYIFAPETMKKIRPLLTRIKYGVKEELMDLVSFKGVGRTRARILFDAGYRKRTDIMTASESKLASLHRIGNALAKSLKEQAGGSAETKPPEADWAPDDDELEAMAAEYEETKVSKQSNLMDFR